MSDIMTSQITILDKFLPKTYEDEISRHMESLEFPWFYNPNISYTPEMNAKFREHDANIKEGDGFVSRLILDNNKVNGYGDLVKPVMYFVEDKFQMPLNHIIRARAVMIYKNPTFGDFYNVPHVDDTDEHLTLIYFVNDSDGDTIIFNELFCNKLDFTKKTIAQRIQPRKGRAVLFNGLRYHTGSVPKNNNRMLINFNFKNV